MWCEAATDGSMRAASPAAWEGWRVNGPSPAELRDARIVWDFHRMGHELRACDVAIGLGSHDLGVASYAAELYHRGLFKVVVFSGASSPTTRARFPRGEAVHYRERAMALGVPDASILVEPRAVNTGQNITLSRRLLEQTGVRSPSVMLISKPYMERRAYATCRKVWPAVEPVATSEPVAFDEYADGIGDVVLVMEMLVGDLQRVIEYPRLGFAVEQDVPSEVLEAYGRLVGAGYISRMIV
jgi:uncharacterized SAM-binding protein YcdF (DUF218 family)